MVRGCHSVYDLTGAELIVKDMLTVADTYLYGELMSAGTVDGTSLGTVISAAPAVGDTLIGVCNEGVTTTGTVAAGTAERIKVIVNPFCVYRIEYDQTGATAAINVDTTISIPDGAGAAGHPNAGGGWLWNYTAGELNWIVSSVLNAGNTDYTVVTGNDTDLDDFILIYPAGGAQYPVRMEAANTQIDYNGDVAVDGTSGYSAVVYNSWVTTSTFGPEMLVPATMDKGVRTVAVDNARLFSDVCFFPSHQLQR